MKKTFTYDYMMKNCGCYGGGKTTDIFFLNNKNDLAIEDILFSGIPLPDKYWFVVRKTELTVYQIRHIAVSVAEIVLPIYEKRYPDDKAPREAIEAAKSYMACHISIESLLEKRRAAYAAADAAACAAAYAATCDANVAYVATDAADAAYVAAYAAADADIKKQLFDFLVNFVKEN